MEDINKHNMSMGMKKAFISMNNIEEIKATLLSILLLHNHLYIRNELAITMTILIIII